MTFSAQAENPPAEIFHLGKTDKGVHEWVMQFGIPTISEDGKIIVANVIQPDPMSHRSLITIFSGSNFENKKVIENSEGLTVYALSGDGKLIATAKENTYSVVLLPIEAPEKRIELNNVIVKDDDISRRGRLVLNHNGTALFGITERFGSVRIRSYSMLSGYRWRTLTNLKNDQSGSIYLLSEDQKIGVGEFYDSAKGRNRVAAWSNDGFSTRTLLPLASDLQAESFFTSMTPDAKVIAGVTSSSSNGVIIWSGDNWSNVTELTPTEGSYEITSFSNDGKVAAGLHFLNNKMYPIIFYGDNWSKHIVLGTDGQENSHAFVAGLSADGNTAVGITSNSSYDFNLIAWRNYLPENYAPPTVINVNESRKSISQLGDDTLGLMMKSQYGLLRLQQSCYTEQGFCYRVSNDFHNSEYSKGQDIALTLGYAWGNGFLFGINLDHNLYQSLPSHFRSSKRNVGVGIFTRYEKQYGNSKWYIAPSLAWNYADLNIERKQFKQTELGKGNSKLYSSAFSINIGQDWQQNNKELGWYASLRHSQVKRTAYTETNVVFPVSYKTATFKQTSIALGAQASIPFTQKLSGFIGVELEQKLKLQAPVFAAEGDYLGEFSYQPHIRKTGYFAYTGVRYQINPVFNIELKPYIGRQGVNYWGVQLNFSGRF